MNEIHVRRLHTDERPTLSIVQVASDPVLCFGLEDRYRMEKIRGDTRIPFGIYPLRWRRLGKWARRFAANYGVPGSLELGNVPGFTDVLIHVGNTKGDTAGCLLLGMGADFESRTVTKSAKACRKLYKRVHALGGEWQIRIEA